MGQIVSFTGGTSFTQYQNKGVGALGFYTNKTLATLTTEQISLEIERSGRKNIMITEGFVPLLPLLICATYGQNAISHVRYTLAANEVAALIELTNKGEAIELGMNDRLKISMRNLDATKVYIFDGIEDSHTAHDVIMYEQKIFPAASPNMDINVVGNDIAVLQYDASITGINFKHDNGNVTQHTWRELHLMNVNADPIASVDSSGVVRGNIDGWFPIPVADIKEINIQKIPGVDVTLLCRRDVSLAAAADAA